VIAQGQRTIRILSENLSQRHRAHKEHGEKAREL
jgi:hypothetical protein